MSSLVQSMAVPVTEDTPPDLLAGSMDLTVLLPDGRATKTSVQRATAMMDLLVQLCTTHRLPPGGHSLQPLGEKGALPYKPSTPIGLLDAWSVRLLPKGSSAGAVPTIQEHPHQLPFQHTFRLQVHLPRNQLLVSRVTPQMGLAAVLKMACEEKNLDPAKYELRHPINLEERLRPELTLGDYGLTEVCVMARDASGADALALQREQERRRRRAKQQHGHVAPPPPSRQPAAAGSAVTGSVSSGSLGGRSSSPDSTPAAPPPRAPARKRRPAPPPPAADARACERREPAVVITQAGPKQVVSHHDGTTPMVTHSRTSSDSSGYHEASVLSDGPDTHPGDKTISSREMPPPTSNSTLPRRSKLPPATGTTSAAPPKRTGPTVANLMPLSRSVSNLASASAVPGRAVHGEHSASTSSLSSTGRGPRKKKAAPPPPPVAAAPAGVRAVPLGGASVAPAPAPAETRASVATAANRTLPRPAASAGSSGAPRAASIEEEKGASSPEQRPSCEATAKHHQQQQRSSAELPAEKADLYAKLQRRLPSRGDSVTSTSSSGSDDAAAATAGRGLADTKRASVPAPAVRPSRSRDRASAAARDLADGESRPGPDVVAVQAPPQGSLSSKHSSIAPDEDDLAVDEGIGNDDAAEEVARAFASATAELEAAILAEDLAAATAAAEADGNPAADYCDLDPPCPTKLGAADFPPQLPPSPDAPPVASDGEEWHYEIPAPPSAFRDSVETPPPTPWSYEGGEVRSKANPLYESGEYVADLSATKEVSASPGESTVATGERNSDRTTGGGEAAETEVSEQQRAMTGAERQLQGVLDAKARLLLPQPQLIQGPPALAGVDASTGVALKDADNEPGEGGQSDVVEDSSMSQEEHRHSHSLLNHHHAGLLHDHHHHHHHHHHDHHHGGHSASAGMPAYLTETIDTLEGFEDLIAVGSGSRPPEEHRNVEDGITGAAEVQVAEEVRRNSSDSERPVVVAEVVKNSEISATLETSSVNEEVAKEKRRNSNSTVETPTESKESSGVSGDAAIESGAVLSRRRSSGEVTVEERKEEVARAESDRQQRAQRRRTVEVGAPLANFTITTYRREIDPDKIFAEAEYTAPSRVPVVTVPTSAAAVGSERRPSLISRSNSVGGSGSSAGSSRRGSQAEQQPGRTHSQGVKRSVSNVYAVLQGVAAREEARLTGAGESNNKEDSGSSQLQSLQVLRSILPQLKSAPEQQRSSGSSEGSCVVADTSTAVPESQRSSRDPLKTTEEARVTEVDAKPHPQPYRPPAISFASWGERPRSRAVSLKVDSDYRVGGAHTKAQQISEEPQPTDTAASLDASKAATVNGATAEKQPELATAEQNVPVRSSESAPTPPQPASAKVEPTVIRISTSEPRIRAVQLKSHTPPSGEHPQPQRSDHVTTRRDSAALTMRIISHTTAAPFVRQGTTSVTVNGDERVVPVVRAVELKKSVLQQKRQAAEGRRADSAEDGEEERFVGVSSLAKRFSFLGDNTVVQRRNPGSSRVSRRPVSELVTASEAAAVAACAEPGGPVHRAGSFASLVTASRASQLGRSDSSDDSGIPHSAGVSSQNGHTSPTAKRAPVTVSAAPKGFPVPVVKGFRVPGGGAPEPRKGITLVARPKVGAGAASSQPPVLNPHEQLMAAIRGFGGTGSLRNQAQKVAECES